MELTNLATELGAIVRKQLVWVYVCWIAATGIALTFVIVPGYQTLAKFEQTECTTVKVLKSGVNPCTYCLQVFVVTKEKTEARPLRHDELADETRCSFKSLCEVDSPTATELFQSLTKTYGVNGTKYSCFTSRSPQSTHTILHIKKYPRSTIIHVVLCLSLSCVVLLACTLHVCRYSKMARKSQEDSRKKISKLSIQYHWKLRHNSRNLSKQPSPQPAPQIARLNKV